MLVDGGLEQVDEPLVRVERAVSVQMLRIAPTEGFATARGRAGPHHTAWKIRVGEQQLEFFDLEVSKNEKEENTKMKGERICRQNSIPKPLSPTPKLAGVIMYFPPGRALQINRPTKKGTFQW